MFENILIIVNSMIIVISNGSSGYDYKCVNSKYLVKANFYFKKPAQKPSVYMAGKLNLNFM